MPLDCRIYFQVTLGSSVSAVCEQCGCSNVRVCKVREVGHTERRSKKGGNENDSDIG